MISIASKWLFWYHMVLAALFMAIVGILVACNEAPTQPRPHGFPAQPRVSTTTPQAEPPKPPAEEEKKDTPYFGSTYWDEILTSVYYYPKSDGNDTPMTHLKFGHRDDELWLCGDQRKSFETGSRIKLLVTFEQNAPCVTNWKVK